jgi:hypothetical protein
MKCTAFAGALEEGFVPDMGHSGVARGLDGSITPRR